MAIHIWIYYLFLTLFRLCSPCVTIVDFFVQRNLLRTILLYLRKSVGLIFFATLRFFSWLTSFCVVTCLNFAVADLPNQTSFKFEWFFKTVFFTAFLVCSNLYCYSLSLVAWEMHFYFDYSLDSITL